MTKREKILETAMNLFVENGIKGTSTASIAKASGVATGTLFHHFKTKEELVMQLYTLIFDSLITYHKKYFKDDESAYERLRQLWYLNLQWGMEHKEYANFLERYTFHFYASNTAMENSLKRFDYYINTILDLISSKLTKSDDFDYVMKEEEDINTMIQRIAKVDLATNAIFYKYFKKEVRDLANSRFTPKNDIFEVYEAISHSDNKDLRNKVTKEALQKGMLYIEDESGTNINVQVFDTAKIDFPKIDIDVNQEKLKAEKPIIIVMDYAFGEQAYETMDELLKPYKNSKKKNHLDVKSVSIMGKAGILEGGKGDIMIPSAHIFEGTADNYPFKNELSKEDLEGFGVKVFDGSMISVLGTSLQNKDLLKFFYNSTWNVIGLEMEGAHYQKAIQSASKIRGNISEDVKVRYAYYASDNPLETGATLASGGLGMTGVTPTYAITQKILEQIF